MLYQYEASTSIIQGNYQANVMDDDLKSDLGMIKPKKRPEDDYLDVGHGYVP